MQLVLAQGRKWYVVYDPARGYPIVVPCPLYDDPVEDVVAAHQRVLEAGGSTLKEPGERPWGVRQAVVVGPGGRRWVLSQHLHDTDPTDWYGRIMGSSPG